LGFVNHFSGRTGRTYEGDITYENARQRVKRGALYLDKIEPWWYKRIDPEKLQIGTGFSCILGQLYGSYLAGLSRARLVDSNRMPGSNLQSEQYGFSSDPGVCEVLQEQDIENLNQAWQEVLDERIEIGRRQEASWLDQKETPVFSIK